MPIGRQPTLRHNSTCQPHGVQHNDNMGPYSKQTIIESQVSNNGETISQPGTCTPRNTYMLQAHSRLTIGPQSTFKRHKTSHSHVVKRSNKHAVVEQADIASQVPNQWQRIGHPLPCIFLKTHTLQAHCRRTIGPMPTTGRNNNMSATFHAVQEQTCGFGARNPSNAMS